MGDIIALKPRPAGNTVEVTAPPQQTAVGDAFCLSCNHTWAGVAPTGTTRLECPQCHRHTGHWKFEFAPAAGQMVRACNCGNQLFYLTPDGHLCASCGIYQSY